LIHDGSIKRKQRLYSMRSCAKNFAPIYNRGGIQENQHGSIHLRESTASESKEKHTRKKNNGCE